MAILFLVILITSASCRNTKDRPDEIWIGTWSTAPQLVEPRNMPPEPGLSNNTLRQVLRVSIGGDELRVKFSNEFSDSPVTLKAVQIAVSSGAGSIVESSIKELRFSGNAGVTLEPGTAISSDPVSFKLEPRMDIAISIFFGETPQNLTGHPGSRTTSYLMNGNVISESALPEAVQTEHWYIISGMDVKAPGSAAAVAILGNSITDGRGSGTNKQNRWPDILSERLIENPSTQKIAVLNLGIGGNCVTRDCLGPSALDRFQRDILKQSGVRWLIILEGVNDLGQTQDSTMAANVAGDLILAYGKMIDEAHAAGIRVYGATILPFNKSFYYAGFRETARNTVNDWIRSSGCFDAVIDFDKVLRDPADPSTLLPDSHTGDFLHPNEYGYRMMGDAIDLKMFENIAVAEELEILRKRGE